MVDDGVKLGDAILKSDIALFLPLLTTSTRRREDSLVDGVNKTKSELKFTNPALSTGE